MIHVHIVDILTAHHNEGILGKSWYAALMNGASKQSFILLPSNGIEVVFST